MKRATAERCLGGVALPSTFSSLSKQMKPFKTDPGIPLLLSLTFLVFSFPALVLPFSELLALRVYHFSEFDELMDRTRNANTQALY